MVKRLCLLLAVILLAAVPPARAEHVYSFEVPSMTIDLTPQFDGSMQIVYLIRFKNLSADPIDIVDIGVPHDKYDLSLFEAWIDGHPLPTIRPSSYVKPGVEVPLAPYEIAQHTVSAFKIQFTMPAMVYYDEEDKNFTSIEFGNTFFGSDFTSGAMNLTVNFHFPEGVTGNETKWHRNEPTTMKTKKNHLVFTWVNEGASPSQMVKFGIGYPVKYVDPEKIKKHSHCAELTLACLGLVLTIIPAAIPFLLIGGIILLVVITNRRRMKKYLPPVIGIEGAGPKRGLTAPEAAIVMELPPDRILMMILFGLLKKGAARVRAEKPLKLEKTEPRPKDLRPYELQFLEAIQGDNRLTEKDLHAMFVAMVKAVNAKIKGFSRKETREYYRQIMQAAWKSVEEAATPAVGETFADRADWLLIDDDFKDRTKKVFHERDVILMPHWWGYGWSSHGGTPAASGSFSLPGANWANSFVTSLSNFSNSVVDSVSSFTTKVTQLTNPPPVSSSSGGGRRSGGGCACACACAGCACACAGGGR